ncbi:MAG: hypothetical protein R8F63_19200 [Acidimicrobiales bacterium]|nr:hypothetical protein [Acidimicrobiales bacterium]
MTGLLANRRAFAAAALTVAILLVAVEVTVRVAFDPDGLDEWSAESFLAHERDDHGRLVSEVVAIQSSERPDAGRIILIGGSTIREGLLPDAVIQQEIDAVLGPAAPEVHTLYSFDQSMAETARIALNLPLAEGDTVVISVNPRRFGFGDDALEQEFSASRFSLLPADELDELVSADPIDAARPDPSGITGHLEAFGDSAVFSPWDETAVFEHRLFLRQWVEGRLRGETTQAWQDLFAGRLTYVDWGALTDTSFRDIRRPVRYGYGNQPLTDIEKAELAEIVAETRVQGYLDHHELDLTIAAALTEAIRATGAEVVFLEVPRASQSVAAYGPIWDQYDADVDRLVAAGDATRLDLRSLPFEDDEFFDLEHLLAPARPRLTDAVFEALLDTELGIDAE